MKELIINSIDNNKIIALVEDEQLVEKYDYKEEEQSLEGNIYVGKVENIVKGLQAAFINIGEKRNGFIYVKDILPKVDITKEEIKLEPINKLIKQGSPIIVEVKRDAVDYKGPRVSTHINISGRCFVFMPNANFITVSHKIEDSKKREELKELVRRLIPEGTGAIVRTVAENMSEDEIKIDILNIVKQWEDMKKKEIEKFPNKIYSKGGIIKKTIVDLIDSGLDRIITNNEICKNEIEQILCEIKANANIEIIENPLELYSLKKQLSNLENKKIWLKCGGFIIIEKTEALTAIDVNTGKYVGNFDLEETVKKVNIEAAREISKQIRLRDIGGIIIIDFIDMKNEENKKDVINAMIESSKKDRSKLQVEGFTKLNLVELTRKHISSKK